MQGSDDAPRAQPKLARPTGPPPSCPRCHAGPEHTRFAFFNNKNPDQPRYYCKACQRHWTAGGTLRQVETGAGKRSTRSVNKSRSSRRDSSRLQPADGNDEYMPGDGAEQAGAARDAVASRPPRTRPVRASMQTSGGDTSTSIDVGGPMSGGERFRSSEQTQSLQPATQSGPEGGQHAQVRCSYLQHAVVSLFVPLPSQPARAAHGWKTLACTVIYDLAHGKLLLLGTGSVRSCA